MFISKLRMTLGVILALSLISGIGVGAYCLRGQAPEQPPPDVGRPPAPGTVIQTSIAFPEKRKPTDLNLAPAKSTEELRQLLMKRRDEAEREAKVRYELYRAGAQGATLDVTIGSFKRLRNADLTLFKDRADRLAIHDRHLRLMREIAQICERKYKVGRISQADYAQAEYESIDAEIELEREKTGK